MKKIITLIMAFLVCAAMAVPAFASTADTTITGFSVNAVSYTHLQGLVLGSISHKHGITALVDKDDVHCLMIGASGVGKTAYFLYPNLEYACASGMSFLALDTKGDLARNYGAIAEKYYGYHVSVVDLRNPTRSDGYNLMTLINHYMDAAQATGSLAARAKAEKYAKILAKTDRKSTRLNSSHRSLSRMPSSA